MGMLNYFFAVTLNLAKTQNTWSLDYKGYNQEKGEKSSIKSKKYFASVVKSVETRPHKSM